MKKRKNKVYITTSGLIALFTVNLVIAQHTTLSIGTIEAEGSMMIYHSGLQN